ncbi:MAG: hypothetical protein MUE30_03275 [Spirosomaceae bacterium]|jgi:hypothetical protein|nr:hypothetical protein [Spirosomataceae bacterium]
MAQQDEQITLSPKLIFQKLIQTKDIVIKNWWLIILITGIGAAIGYYVDSKKNKRTQYVAKIVFSISGSGGGQDMGGLGSLLGMAGGGSGDASLFRGENLFYIMKTRPVLEKALLSKVKLNNGTEDYFLNVYLDSTFIRQDEWAEIAEGWLKVRMTKDSRAQMAKTERDVFDNALLKIRDRELFIAQPDVRTAFYQLLIEMDNEFVSKTFAELILKTVEEVYQDNQTKKSKEMKKVLEDRVAQISGQLNNTESRLAQTTAINTDAVIPTAKVNETRLTRSSTFLTSLYLEASRNLENVKMSIIKESPLFTVHEPPLLPLETKLFTRENTKFGIALGLLVAIVVALAKDTYQAALKDMKKQ